MQRGKMGRILIVDDEPHMRRILVSNLRQDQHQTWEAAGVQEARRHLATSDYDAVFTDQKMQDGEGLEVLKAARESDPSLSVVFLTAVGTIELAVESMRHGAFVFTSAFRSPSAPRLPLARAEKFPSAEGPGEGL